MDPETIELLQQFKVDVADLARRLHGVQEELRGLEGALTLVLDRLREVLRRAKLPESGDA